MMQLKKNLLLPHNLLMFVNTKIIRLYIVIFSIRFPNPIHKSFQSYEHPFDWNPKSGAIFCKEQQSKLNAQCENIFKYSLNSVLK